MHGLGLKVVRQAGIISAILLVSVSACSWFKVKPRYEGAETGKPLEIPAGLDRPNSQSALRIPSKSLTTVKAGNAQGVFSVLINADLDKAWDIVGKALDANADVTVVARTKSLNSYEVRFAQQTFLVNLQNSANKTRVVAIDAKGAISETDAAGLLLASIKAKL